MAATSTAGTCSSTISTRLRVPVSRTVTMPTETWNSDRRSNRDRGSSVVAASANGRQAATIRAKAARLASAFCRRSVIGAPAPGPVTCRSQPETRRVRVICRPGSSDSRRARTSMSAGAMAGARSARKQLSCHEHQHQGGRPGRNGEHHRAARAVAQCRDHVLDLAGRIVDQAVHRHDVIELAELGLHHVASLPVDAARQIVRGPFARDVDQAGRDVDCDDVGTAPRSLNS
jgi:hypothetical protein